QVLDWPISVGSAPPATAAAGLVSGFAASGFAEPGFAAPVEALLESLLESLGDALCACARSATPHITPLATSTARIRRTDITKSGSLNIVTGRWLRHRIVRRTMDSREMAFWEGSCQSLRRGIGRARAQRGSRFRSRGALLLPLRVGPLQQILGAGTAQMRAAVLHHHLAIDVAGGIGNQKTRKGGDLAIFPD